jgi:hypothetical protein
MTSSSTSDEIRKLVREVLKEFAPAAQGNGDARVPSSGQVVEIAIASDADIMRFAQEIAGSDNAKKDAILSGRLRFALKRASGGTRNGGQRVDKGVLTEAMVVEIGRSSSRVILGKSVAVTPLARDKAREMRLEIVRDK